MQDALRQLFETYHRTEYLSSDPLEFVHHYAGRPADQEIVALLCALTAYGNVKQIRASIREILGRLEAWAGGPAAAVERLRDPARAQSLGVALKGYKHRFNPAGDWVRLLRLAARSARDHGSLGAHFATHLKGDDADIGAALTGWVGEWKSWGAQDGGRKNLSFAHLLASPKDGSACKRWCMFLRWMGRSDAIDPGLWMKHGLKPMQLVIPLDTHVGRISQYLALTDRRTLNWKTALEITARLRALDPSDPVRYDFALSRLGILDQCQKKYDRVVCGRCALLPACRYAAQKGQSTRSAWQPAPQAVPNRP